MGAGYSLQMIIYFIRSKFMSKGLYIHVPFCVRKCPYCDFFSVTDLSLREAYTEAVIRNIRALNDSFSTVYFGGGTPSLLTEEQIHRILSAAEILPGAEISMEANPGTADEDYLRNVRSAGINRISLGVQSFDNGELKSLGRIHSSEEAVSAILSAEKAGFENISADLMLAVSGQTPATLRRNLETVVSLPLTHISAYMLKVESGTPLSLDNELLEKIPDEDETAEMYLEAVNFLENQGFEQYEISNFAHNGFECRHNLGYWKCGEYYGIGCSAHSFIDGERFCCRDSLREFIASPIQGKVSLGSGGDAGERAMLALRLTKEGIPANLFPGLEERSKPLVRKGLMKKEQGFLKLTPEGCLVSNEIIIFCGLTDMN